MENELEDIVTDDEAIDNEETELTVEDYKKEKEGRIKAVNKYVLPAKKLMEKYGVKTFEELEEKIQSKDTTTGLTEEKLALREELTEFLADNKDLKEYKSELLKYREQGFTMKQAVALVENDDKTIENRKKANLNISSGDEGAGKTVYTYADLEKMSQSDYNRVKELQLKGKVKFKN